MTSAGNRYSAVILLKQIALSKLIALIFVCVRVRMCVYVHVSSGPASALVTQCMLC